MDKVNVLPGDLNTAAGMLEQAAQLAPNDALVWSTWALLDLRYVSLDFDNTPSRHNVARAHAAQANALDPDSRETRYTQAEVMRSLAWDPATQAAAEKVLRPMLSEAPQDGRVLIPLGWVAFAQGRLDDAVAHFERAALLPACAVHATYCKALVLALRNHFEACDRALDQLLMLAPTHAFGLCQKAALSLAWHGDLEASRAFIERVPPQMRVEDMSASFAYGVYMTRREYDLAVQAIRAVPRDYLSAQPGPGPSGFYIGEALAAAGKNAAAEIEWRSALATVERRLAEAPSDETLMKFKALLLARLGDRVAAERVWKAVVELHGDMAWGNMAPLLHVVFLPPDEAIAWLNDRLADPQYWFTAAILRLSPLYDPLRSNPKFTALVEKMEADPRFSPKAKQVTAEGGQRSDSNLPATHSSLLATPQDKSVAVLAFANLSDDKGNEYFSDGISEELLNVLAKVPGLTVKGRSSGFFFKGKDTPVPEIAQQLGVTYVVQGSVRKAGNRVRISAQLIRAASDEVVWSSGSLDRDLQDIFAVQDEIAGLVAQQLQLKLGVTKPAREVNPEAHRLLLEARHYWHQRGEQNFDRTEALLRQALAIDPDFAPAHAAMADLWVMRAAYRTTEGVADLSEELRSLRTSAARATELDSSLVAPIAAMAYGLLIEGRMEAAQQQFEAAVARSPNDPTVRLWRALFLMQNGDFDAAYQEFAHARELDPKAWIITHLSGQNALQLGRKEEALALFRQANADRPDGFAPAVGYESLALWQSGRSDEAVTAARAVRQTWPRQPRWQADAHAIWVLRQAGLTTEAAAHADAVLAGLPAQTYQRGFVLAALGRFDEALPYLEGTTTLARDAVSSLVIFDPWRDDPRFAALIEKLHWTEQYARAREAMKQAAATAKR
ncbi:MAG TPA: tetratricopeptide repeat protein [Opitutaceae bacterium]|nr:tetratricopeptide repeat protein [Opitutaceae bacterium]